MLTTIFGKPLDKVTTDDVRTFCDKQVREGVNLDYKRNLRASKKIVKAIAAFGNTRGGWIIAGVEDQDDKPVRPVSGIEFQEHLPLRITNMILSHMFPPLIPHLHVCPPDSNNKTFILIYVPESHEAPHWLFNKSELYIRVADRTSSGNWERFATSEEWEWLRRKREKSAELREETEKELEYYFWEYDFKEEINKISEATFPATLSRDRSVSKETKDMLNLTITPTYPKEALMSVPETFGKLDEISIPDHHGTGNQFPPFLDDRRVFQKGTLIYRKLKEGERRYFTALQITGMLMFKETVLFWSKPPAKSEIESVPYVEFARIISRLDEFLTISSELFNKISYKGLLTFSFFLDGESWMQMKFPVSVDRSYKSVSDSFFWSDVFLTSYIEEENTRYQLLRRVVKDLMFAFGWKDFNWSVLNGFLTSRNLYQSILTPK